MFSAGPELDSTVAVKSYLRAGCCGLRYRTRKTKTAKSNEQKSAKVLQFPKRVVSRKVDTTFGYKGRKLALAA